MDRARPSIRRSPDLGLEAALPRRPSLRLYSEEVAAGAPATGKPKRKRKAA